MKLKRILYGVLCLAAIALVSCSKQETVSNPLVGSWFSSVFVGGKTLTFSNDYYFTDDWHSVEHGSYAYSEKTKVLTLHYDSGKAFVYLVTELTDTRLTLVRSDTGSTEAYIKQ